MKPILSPRFSACLVALVALVAATVMGCDKSVKKTTLHGTITYKGQPLRSGILKFAGPGGSYSAATIQSDGSFIITDVVPGEVKVGVVAAPKGSGGPGAPAEPKVEEVSLPAKYQDPETSDLKYTITSGMTELAIKIE